MKLMVLFLFLGIVCAGCASSGPSRWAQTLPLSDRVTRLQNKSDIQDMDLKKIKDEIADISAKLAAIPAVKKKRDTTIDKYR